MCNVKTKEKPENKYCSNFGAIHSMIDDIKEYPDPITIGGVFKGIKNCLVEAFDVLKLSMK